MSVNLKDRTIDLEDRMDAVADILAALQAAPAGTTSDDDSALGDRVTNVEDRTTKLEVAVFPPANPTA